MMAMSVLGSLPVLLLFLFFQRYFIAGMTAGSVEGSTPQTVRELPKSESAYPIWSFRRLPVCLQRPMPCYFWFCFVDCYQI
jgi:hypothetical protein